MNHRTGTGFNIPSYAVIPFASFNSYVALEKELNWREPPAHKPAADSLVWMSTRHFRPQAWRHRASAGPTGQGACAWTAHQRGAIGRISVVQAITRIVGDLCNE